ncbi:MAG: hypothetical protein JXA42_18670 [Anaerolineales bacterium]|nr:hypothetical protein [Anaerolineales bacterium]
MENTMLFVKYALFFALEFAVLVAVGAVLAGGIYQLVRDAIHKVQRSDKISQAPKHVA